MSNNFHDFVNVIKKDPTVRNKINVMLDTYNRISLNYQSNVGYDTLVHNVILKEMIKIMAKTILDLDIELKKKISGIDYLESRTNTQIFKRVW